MNFRIGIFDSGVGGFTVLKSVIERHGDLQCVYLADTARIPYGEKSIYEIRQIANEIIHWMKSQNVGILLVACNTTNSLALDLIKNKMDIPVLDLINSCAKKINAKRVGVIATTATVASDAYKNKIEFFNPNTIVIQQACPGLVPLIESGMLTSKQTILLAKNYLHPLLVAQVEEIILGCSHYPLIESIFKKLIPSNVKLIDPSVGLARDLDEFIASPKDSLMRFPEYRNTRICVTSEPLAFASRTKALLGKCPEVQMVSLRSKACFF